MPRPESERIVVLLGGASGVGKSMLNSRLAHRLGINLTEIDDLHIAVETVTGPADQPLLHFWRTNVGEYMSWTDEARVEHHVRLDRRPAQHAHGILAEHDRVLRGRLEVRDDSASTERPTRHPHDVILELRREPPQVVPRVVHPPPSDLAALHA